MQQFEAVLCRSTLDEICGTACSIRSTPQYRSVLHCVVETQSGAIRRLSLRAFQFSKESFFPKYFISDLFERELMNQQV